MLSTLVLFPLLASLATATPIHKRTTNALISSGRDGKCLSASGTPYNGLAVTSVDCATATGWDINPGSGSVILSGTNYALDAGSNPGNNGALKVWQSYPGLYQQTWYLTGDNRIAITGGDQCLDEGDNGIQTYQCTTGNTNQIFLVNSAGSTTTAPPTSSTSSTPAPTSLPDVAVGPVYQDPSPGSGRRLHPYGRADLCVTVQNGYAAYGANVAISSCFSNNDPFVGLQLWDADNSAGNQQIKLHGEYYNTTLCLDAGENPSNGGGISIQQCGNGISTQTWNYSGTNVLSVNNGYSCLDVQEGSGRDSTKPYNALKQLQIYQCFAGNTNQIFFELPYPM